MRHHVDRVHVPALLAGNALHHGFGHALGALGPDVDNLVVLLTRGDQAILVLLLEVLDLLLSLTNDVPLVVRDYEVVLAKGNPGRCCVLETQRHQRIGKQHRILLPGRPVDGVDQLGGFLLGQHLVDGVESDRHRAGQHVGQQHPARRGFTHAQHRLAVLIEVRNPCPHLGVHGNRFGSQRVADFLGRTEDRTRPDFVFLALDRQVVDPQDDILARNDDRLAVGRREDVVGRHHQAARFELGFQRQRHVHGHLVAVEVSVEGGTDQRVQVDGLALDQHRFEGLNAQAVQGRRPVQHDRVLADHLLEDIPDLGAFLLHHALGGLDRRREPVEFELGVDERLEQLQRHLLRDTALVQLQRRAHHDHGTTGVVDALAEQVLTEPALLALEHVGERLQRTLVGAGDDPATAAVVEQGVDRFLQHPLLVADDDVRRAQFDQPLQAVVPVDHAAVEVVEVGGREPATVQRHQRAQLRGNDRQHVEHHPFGLGAGLDQVLDQLEPLDQLLALGFGVGLAQLVAQRFLLEGQVEVHQQVLERLSADLGGEAVLAEVVLRLVVLLFAQQLVHGHGGHAGIDDHEALEVEHALEILERHVEHQADAGRQRLQEPDVGNRGGEVDVTHALAANLGERDFDTALLTDNALVLHALVLAAQALVVLHRAEDLGTEQAVALGLEGPVVDGLRLLDLAEGPGADALRAGDADLQAVEGLQTGFLAKDFADFVHVRLP